MRYLALILLAGCSLPFVSVPDTRPISEFEMFEWVRDSIASMFVGATEEMKERASCLWGYVEQTETQLPDYDAPRYFKLWFDSISPARTTGATENTVSIHEDGPCEEGAVGVIHTHLVPGRHSAQDLVMFLRFPALVTFVVDGVGIASDGTPAVRLHYVMRHGQTGTWFIPYKGER